MKLKWTFGQVYGHVLAMYVNIAFKLIIVQRIFLKHTSYRPMSSVINPVCGALAVLPRFHRSLGNWNVFGRLAESLAVSLCCHDALAPGTVKSNKKT